MRAAAGDERAFEQLLTDHRVKLRNVCHTFVGYDTSVDDLFQIVCVKLWAEVSRGHYNPHRADFVHFASTVAHQALRDDKLRRRAQKRFAVIAPVPLDTLDIARDSDSDAPIWRAATADYRLDPLAVVIWRETLRESWEALTRTQIVAVTAYLAKDHGRSGGIPENLVTAMCDARRRVRPLIAASEWLAEADELRERWGQPRRAFETVAEIIAELQAIAVDAGELDIGDADEVFDLAFRALRAARELCGLAAALEASDEE